MNGKRVLILAALVVLGAAGMTGVAAGNPFHFVPNSFEFWDFSKNWTTNYGPAYRDTVEDVTTNFLPCTGQFALCFHSGAEPLPCRMTNDGRFANCTCTVQNGTNYVLITAILNHAVYRETVRSCGTDGRFCKGTDTAPVCQRLDTGHGFFLIPGAQVISTFDTSTTTAMKDADAAGPSGANVQNCEGPFAGCMTAGCRLTKDGEAECTCPVFWGRFQLVPKGAQCDLGPDLVPSASYNPKLDPTVP